MLRLIDNLLNKFTMYRFILYGLRTLAAISITLSFFGVLGQPFLPMLITLGLLSAASYSTNTLLSRLFRVPANTESYAITLLILFFILPPATTLERGVIVVLAAVLAVASKFLVTSGGKHIFNPAAFGATAVGVLGLMHATWWVGSSVLWPFTLLLGLLVVRKIRRFSMVLTFAVVSLAVSLLVAAGGQSLPEVLRFAALSSPLIFLGTIMLTDPQTMPGRRNQQIVFGAIVGLLYATSLNIGPVTISPEVALIIGNLYAFAVNQRYRMQLRLQEAQKVSDRVYNYVFTSNRKAFFLPGQYAEWTVQHSGQDNRGNRRTFSFASSPTEDTVQLGVKFSDKSSSFKKALQNLQPGDTVYAGQIAGDFILPKDKSEKLLFIAGGIGITPFRSMLKYIMDINEKRDIVLIYAVPDPTEVAYADVLQAAEHSGVKVIRLLTNAAPPKNWQGIAGKLNADLILKQVPDYDTRTIYLSGPNGLVQGIRAGLLKAGTKSGHIKTDYFTGY